MNKHYSTAILTDLVTVYYLDSKGNVIGELFFKWFMDELRMTVHQSSFHALRLAEDIYSDCEQRETISPDEFIRILQGLEYTEQ